MPRIVDKEQRRGELLEAVVDVIADRGLDGATLMDVARQAGVTTGTIGYYFRDKDDLLVAALDHLAARVTDRDAPTLTFFDGGLGLHLPTTEEARRLWSVWLAYCGAAPSSPRLLAAYRDFYADIEAGLADHLEARGHTDPRALAGTIVATVDGIGLCATVAPDLWPAERQIQTMQAVLTPLLAETSLGVSS